MQAPGACLEAVQLGLVRLQAVPLAVVAVAAALQEVAGAAWWLAAYLGSRAVACPGTRALAFLGTQVVAFLGIRAACEAAFLVVACQGSQVAACQDSQEVAYLGSPVACAVAYQVEACPVVANLVAACQVVVALKCWAAALVRQLAVAAVEGHRHPQAAVAAVRRRLPLVVAAGVRRHRPSVEAACLAARSALACQVGH
jgi:hypothetical protein